MIEIKGKSGEIKLSTEINEGSKYKFLLMKEDYVTLKFSLLDPVFFKLGDGFSNIYGLFEVVDLYKPDYNKETGGYDYELRLDAWYYKFKNKIFKYTPETGGSEASWSLTASLSTHLGIYLRNLVALGYDYNGTAVTFSIDDTVSTESQLISYDNTNLIDALTQMADTWDCEWWIIDNVIHFGKCEFGETSKEFETGVNVESISRSDSDTDYATRIIAFGSTKNIPTNYRTVDSSVVVSGVVESRLMLPAGTPYVDADEDMIEEEAVEKIIVFEDIYPRQDGTISEVTQSTGKEVDDDGNETGDTYPIFQFKDASLINFKEEYLLDELRLVFSSGLLNGLDLALTLISSDDSGTVLEIVRNDDYGRSLPDEYLYPAVGDTYNLYGYNTSYVNDQLVTLAEAELKEAAEAKVAELKIDPSTYECTMISDRMYNDGDPVSLHPGDILGQKVKLIDKGLFEDSRISRVIGVELNLDIPYDSPVITIGESVAYSLIGDLESQVDEIVYKNQTYTSSSGNSVYVIKTTDSTTPTDSNVYSAKRSSREFLSKKSDDTAAGQITFKKGIVSEGLTDTVGLVVRADSSDSVSSGLTETDDSDDSSETVVSSTEETTSTEEEDGTSLGELTNVNAEVDETDAYDMFLARSAGDEKWSKKKISDYCRDGVIAYPTMYLNPLTGRLVLQVPTNNYDNRFAVEDGHLILKQS